MACFLPETIESVINQIYQEWEMIIIDDASTDESLKIAHSFSLKDPRIKVIRFPGNLGQARARNAGISLASGRFIAFLDSDDIWYPDRLISHIHFMLKNKVAFSHASYEYIDQKGKKLSRSFNVGKYPVSYNRLLLNHEISCLTALYDTKIYGKVLMPDLSWGEDLGLWLKLLRNNKIAIPFQKEIAAYRLHPNSKSYNKKKLIPFQWNFYRHHLKSGFWGSIFLTMNWGIKGLIKYYWFRPKK